MLRQTLIVLAAPASLRAEASAFGASAMGGKLFQTRLDTFFADAAGSAEQLEMLSPVPKRHAQLKELYAAAGGNAFPAEHLPIVGPAKRMAADKTPEPLALTASVTESIAALTLLRDALVEHAKAAVEFGRPLGDTEGAQLRLSRLSASIFALEACYLAVATNVEAAPAVALLDAPLMSLAARAIAARRVSEAVSLMNPSCVFLPDGSSDVPWRFRAVRHIAEGLRADGLHRTITVESPAVVELVAAAAKAAVADSRPNPVVAAVTGRGADDERRAAHEFPCHMTLKLPTVQLSRDMSAARTQLAGAKKLAASPAGTAAVAAALSELFACTCAVFRASGNVEADETAGYADVLKAQVFLEESRAVYTDEIQLFKSLAGKHGAAVSKAVDANRDATGKLVTAPSELPPPQQAKPAAGGAEAEPKKE